MRHIRLIIVVITALAGLFVLPGCGRSTLPRFDCVPGPVRTIDLATAAAAELAPLSSDEWASLESMHDRYLRDFDRVREEAIAPLVREARAHNESALMQDAELLARLARKHGAALARITALDAKFQSDLAEAFPERAEFVARVTDRRTVSRSAHIVEGLFEGDDRSPTILDLEPLITQLRLTPDQRTQVEPVLAVYRSELARGAEQLARAMILAPSDRLTRRLASGLSDESVAELAKHVKESDAAREAYEQAALTLAADDRAANRPTARAYQLIDDANRRGLAALTAVLPESAAAQLTQADERRRSSLDPYMEIGQFTLDVYAHHPDVLSGKARKTVAALSACREKLAALIRQRIEDERARLAAADSGELLPDNGMKARAEALQAKALTAFTVLLEVVPEEINDGTFDLLKRSSAISRDEMVEQLTPVIGAQHAERAARAVSRTMFRSAREQRDPKWNQDLSIAEQLLLAPGMDHSAFRRAARAIGARDDDPLVEQIWDRHESRVAVLLVRQRDQLRVLEKKTMEAGGAAEVDPISFERSLGEYLQSLLAADGDRRAADEETFKEIAIAIGVSDDDARYTLARAVSAARRASLPWRRFRQSWLLGALWEADADPISTALELDDEVSRNAALTILSAHADLLRATADDARRAGLEALRDFLLVGARSKRNGKSDDAESMRNSPDVKSILSRVNQAAKARRDAQRQAISSLAAVDAALGEKFYRSWLQSTFPEFFADGIASRIGAEQAAMGAPNIQSDVARAFILGAIERWRAVDQDMMIRLGEWQDSRRLVSASASGAELTTNAAMDPELGALQVLRDENAWRMLRSIASLQGKPPNYFMQSEDAVGATPRPAIWSP